MAASQVQPVTWRDSCCWGRSRYDFDDPDDPESTLNRYETFLLLQKNKVGLLTVTLIQILFMILWMLATGIPGFNLYDGAVGTVR